MAIGIYKYVDVGNDKVPGATSSRNFSGLVITAEEMLGNTNSDYKPEYDKGEIVSLDLSDVAVCFGKNSNAYKIAERYFSYSNPSGNVCGYLQFAKLKKVEVPSVEYAPEVAYEIGAVVKHEERGYECKEAVTVDENTDWDSVSSKFEEKSLEEYETASMALARVDDFAYRFGSFTFVDSDAHEFDDEELKNAAGLNAGYGLKYLMVVNKVRGTKTADEITSNATSFGSIRGLCYVCGKDVGSAAMPMAIFDATDYVAGPVTTHMFKQFPGEGPTVLRDSEYDKFRASFVNFYGRTQSNGSTIDFYQHGYNLDGEDTAVYCNEIYLRFASANNVLRYLVSQDRVPANFVGVAQVRARVVDTCSSLAPTGIFSVKTVSQEEKTEISQLIASYGGSSTEITDIFSSIESSGWAVYATLAADAGSSTNIIRYFVFYGTADSVRMVKGEDISVK